MLRKLRAVALTIGLCVASVSVGPWEAPASATSTKLSIVAGELQYANVAQQIGGPYVSVTALMTNPNTDPHAFEASSQVAREIASANVLVQNGLGYDSFMSNIAKASPSSSRKTITVSSLVHLMNESSNPHLWYSPATMPAFAQALATQLSSLDPTHREYFQSQLKKFDASLSLWLQAIATCKSHYAGVGVAVTEPVADYLLLAMGLTIKTPYIYQADVMNGVDPSPQDIATQQSLISSHHVRSLVYNEQVSDALTSSVRSLASANRTPVVGVYEIMPTGMRSYQEWMLSATADITASLIRKK